MLQNRVDPFGRPHAVPQRGAWFGNKGCLHDPAGRIRRFHSAKRWITCLCAFKGRRRTLLQPGRYTELFFHDEATAYAAGHRPCAECRRPAWTRFMDLWAAEFGRARTDDVDTALHAARLAGKTRRLVPVSAGAVPTGAMIVLGDAPVLRGRAGWYAWDFAGYQRLPAVPGTVRALTPLPVLTLLQRGLPVQMALSEI